MGEENQTNQNIDIFSNQQNINLNGNDKKKGKKKAILITVILLVVAIIIGIIYYFTNYIKPDMIYKRLITSTINSYTNKIKNMDYETSKTSLKLDADVDVEEMDEKVNNLINKINMEVDMQTNNVDKQVLMNLKANYDQEDLLQFQMYSDLEEEETYMQFKNLLDKYIEIDNMDDEFYTQLKEILENQKLTTDQKKSLQKITETIKKELTNVVKKEYCTAQKEDITINNKTVSTTKNTIKMNGEQLKQECSTVFENLMNNEEFVSCFEDEYDLQTIIEDLCDAIDDAIDDETVIELNLYTDLFMQKVEKCTLIVYDEDNEEVASIAITKTDSKTYYFEISEEDETICTAVMNIEEKNKEQGIIHLEIEIPDFGKLKLNIEYNQQFNQKIDEINVEDSVKFDELTEEDQKTLSTNLEKTKLYEIIKDISGEDLDLINDEDEDEEQYESDDEKSTSETKDNEIISYNDKQKITFGIPEGYESIYSTDNYKSLEKGNMSIKISTLYGNKERYYEDLKEKKSYYEEDSTCKNVQLSDIDTIEVEGKTFYQAILSYEYADEDYTDQYKTLYIWSEISNQYLIEFEIKNSDDMKEEEIKELLKINIEEIE